jgi:hypothetical protein
MPKPTLGRLEKVTLRDIWKSEARDFTPWLGLPENLSLLGDTVGMDLELEKQEKEVGPFRADLLCKNTIDGSWVLIENQIEKTDHNHLGQILTYAAGLEAVAVIWIAEYFTDEHRAALDWLNEITQGKFVFFGLEMEVWKIGGSAPAPKFNIVSKPNEWSKEVQTSAAAGELTESKRLQLKFWTAYREYMKTASTIRCQKPAPQNWINHPLGRSGAHFTSVASLFDSAKNVFGGENRVELVLDGSESKEWFSLLEGEKPTIEKEVGSALTWHNPMDARMSRIYIRQTADIQDESDWPRQFNWLRENLEVFAKVFKPRVMTFGREG